MFRSALAAAVAALLLSPALGAVEIRPFATLQHDAVRVDHDQVEFDDVDGFRRLRAGLRAKFGAAVDLKVEYDLINDRWNDMVVQWKLGDGALRAGHFKPPFGLEQLGSSSWSGFGERAAVNALAPGRRFGLEYGRYREQRGWALAGFGQDSTGALDGQGVALRGSAAWSAGEGQLLHLGAALAHEDPDGDTLRLSSRPDVSLVGYRGADTGSFEGVDSIGRIGLEAAWQRGPLLLQGEWMQLDAGRDLAPDFSADGGYLAAQWLFGGHSRRYGRGLFSGPDLGDGDLAFELGLRLSTLDLDDGGIDGGEFDTVTLGASLYVGRRARFLANLVEVDSRRGDLDDHPRLLMLRAQFLY